MARPPSTRKPRTPKASTPRTARRLTAYDPKLVETQKLAVLGTLSASIVHEIRNPLASLSISLDTIERHLPDDARLNKAFAHSRASINRIQAIIHSTLGFANNRPDQLLDVDTPDIIRESLAFVQAHIQTKAIEFTVGIERNPFPVVQGNREQLQQALINILTNAVESIDHSGRITFMARTKPAGAKRQVVWEISDSGSGMSKAEQKKIFNAFYSGKASGTGLGLSITRQILDRHHAVITVDSAPGKGTTFVITFPAMEKNR